MLTTLQGTCENGSIKLDEPVPPDLTGRVLITFLPENNPVALPETKLAEAAKTPLSLIKPKQPRFSFDEALSMPVKAGSSVSDAIMQEREQSNW